MKTEIYIATHKAYDFPQHLSYIPIHVGKALTDLNLGILGDNTGDNISELNKSFCELTALYWMWKNSDADILGLAHYRRYFSSDNPDFNIQFNNLAIINPDMIASTEDRFIYIAEPTKLYYKKFKINFSVSMKKQYELNHFKKDWDIVRNILLKKYPDYKEALIDTENKKKISFFNMMVTDRKTFNNYCEWLFDILFECNVNINVDSYNPYQKRLFGFLSERLLNIFISYNKVLISYKKLVNVE